MVQIEAFEITLDIIELVCNDTPCCRIEKYGCEATQAVT